ncbi:hypothetical protein P22_3170 [Propionispora sp. 2/2-37]|uniref:alpha-L-rhamnosidase n=1 Tax=Propionispora sp. 2/2-37 TaxID=1677858 RepID=UPI0006BB6376|nr:alpha-L-rhamnosidase [Propionispora sp. 2/2-37]CUH97044.1 hypothetical protein P22_3170 [Propionispora sp. 2/2-37]
MFACKKLLTEYQSNPIGLDVSKPRFSWQLDSEEYDTVQTAYQIIVKAGEKLVWDSTKVASDQSIHVEYAGAPLEKATEYSVAVRVWDNHGNEAAVQGRFETGLLSYENFTANWITHTLANNEEACPILRRHFTVKQAIRSARIYATALGLYELNLNDRRVGDAYFTPGWTSYHNRLQYQTYDVTDHLRDNNQLEIILANGWYKGEFGFTDQKNNYGDRLAALLELHIVYEDGSEEILVTDESWQCATGSIRYSEIYHGETIDSTFTTAQWLPVNLYDCRKEVLIAQECELVKIVKRLPAIALIHTPAGDTVLDFGQNLTGFVEFNVNCAKGTEIVIRHAEVLDKDGNFYTENLRTAQCTDRFICKGGPETFRPHFTFHGFRYIAVEGMGAELALSDFTACVLHTDMELTGSFTCSNQLVNQLQHNIEWGQRGNFLDVPTDCPQRNERLGWTGDAQVFARTAAYNMNVALFFTKWLRDLAVEQTEEFGVPQVVPNIMGDQKGVAAWSDAATIIPWTMYVCYGDTRLLSQQYASMKGWVEYMHREAGDSYLWQAGFQYGDWLALDKEEFSDRTGATDRYYVATAFYAYSTDLVRKAAKVLGYDQDYQEYTKLYENIIKAFREEYVTKTGRLVSETQTACVLALMFDLVEDKDRPRVIETLKNNLKSHRDHLVTGFVGTPYICHALSENGLHEIAGKLLLRTDYPSWLYAVTKGATTIWERWNGILPDGSFETAGMNSFNHYAYGSIGDWLYRKVAGIDALEAGHKTIRIAPMFVKGLTSAKGELETMYGKIISSWKCKDGRITIDIAIPANCTAKVSLPEKSGEFTLGSGRYHYEYPTENNLELQKYTMESTLRQIMANPLAVELLERISPGFGDNPMLEFALDMTVNEISAVAPGTDAMFEPILVELNKAE